MFQPLAPEDVITVWRHKSWDTLELSAMKELDELKESIASLDKALAKGMPIKPGVEIVLVSDCLTGIVKVLEALATLTEQA